VVVPTLIAEIEQDYMYWPLKCKHLAKQWRTNTEWGRLFEHYRQEGCLVA
jgi:hypothetical protein